MSLISQFFGRKDEPSDNAAALVAASDVEHPLSLAVVFDGPLQVDTVMFESALRAYHPSMQQARVEMIPQLDVVGLGRSRRALDGHRRALSVRRRWKPAWRPRIMARR